VASAFAIDYFRGKNIPLSTSVNMLLAKTKSKFRIENSRLPGTGWHDDVTIEHLMSHSALNMHYVQGFKIGQKPNVSDLLGAKFGYQPLEVINKPGSVFSYSGGGFLVLEHLIETLENKPVRQIIQPFLDSLGLKDLSFETPDEFAHGYFDSGEEVPGGALEFPSFAAGAFGSASVMTIFLRLLTEAYNDIEGSGAISHDTAVTMLRGTDKGCRAFMGCQMGLGIFICEAGENKLAIHQGANEGFRALFLHCFSGPDKGKGFTILCNADHQGVLFIAEVAQEILRQLRLEGIDYSEFKSSIDLSGLPQEQVVNLGYKELIFRAFSPTLPEKIENPGPLDPLAPANLAIDAAILNVSNQRFARAENLIRTFWSTR
jgi:hypothetical protein